ncbi:MAG: very short patch repair endonuclease [Frankiaceae bacterium]|nr:very short patch repair endonuclease [Frankiaceae bacterium]MBV9369403.1 very short patch repair endonuclease [Frankiales bacterium]
MVERVPKSPPASSAGIRRRMQVLSKKRDTAPELVLRRELHRLGLRYRVDVAPIPSQPRRRADIVFPRRRLAVFVDGCFWHGCEDHGVRPTANAEYWRAKLLRNMERDRETDALLIAAGWRVMRVWEHEPAQAAAARVHALVREGAAGW